jgi:hypothetical protein
VLTCTPQTRTVQGFGGVGVGVVVWVSFCVPVVIFTPLCCGSYKENLTHGCSGGMGCWGGVLGRYFHTSFAVKIEFLVIRW